MTSGIEAKCRFGKQDFVSVGDEDVFRCPAGEKLKYYYTNEERGRSCAATGRMRAVTQNPASALLQARPKAD